MKDLLKFITCGSVDDGKSTLIGHMLYDAKLLFADHERALELDSKLGSRGGAIDYSLLLDGLMAEREQGITIDVAYRYFTSKVRSFIVADCPGHEQYTRNMAVGASFADLAVILVDAGNGVVVQTRRHTRICALLGVRHFVLAVNKMDLVGYEQERFRRIKRAFKGYVADFEPESVYVIPVSAAEGDNVVAQSSNMPWFTGQPLLPYLEDIEVSKTSDSRFYMPVQRVCRPDHTFRGFQGQIEAGRVSVGEAVTIFPSGEPAVVKTIIATDTGVMEASEGQPVTIELDREVDVSRGCVLASEDAPLESDSMFTASLLWMDDAPLVAGRGYLLKCGTKTIPATVLNIKHKVDIETGGAAAAKTIRKNEFAVCDISLPSQLVFAEFKKSRALGCFILIDRISNMTSACGVIEHSLRRSKNVKWQDTDITRDMRAGQMGQTPLTIWFTGLSGSGKSALANQIEKRLASIGKHTMLLDGDNLRHGLCRDLGFTEADRIENIRRVAEVAKLMNDAGIIVLAALISPYKRDREHAREIIGEAFREIYISTPVKECERRDVKGLYKKAREGKLPAFTGVSSPYEPPEKPDYSIDTTSISVADAASDILDRIFNIGDSTQ